MMFRASLDELVEFAVCTVVVTHSIRWLLHKFVTRQDVRHVVIKSVRVASSLLFLAQCHRFYLTLLLVAITLHFVVVRALGDMRFRGWSLAVMYTWSYYLLVLFLSSRIGEANLLNLFGQSAEKMERYGQLMRVRS
jgi:hypothetical protein